MEQVGLALSAQLYPLRATCFDCKGGAVYSFLRTALMIALLNNCLVAKTSRAIFIHPHCLYSDVTATLNQLPPL